MASQTPKKNKKTSVYLDRMLPQPNAIASSLLSPTHLSKRKHATEKNGQESNNSVYDCVLKAELLGIHEEPENTIKSPIKSPASKRIFSYKSPTKVKKTSNIFENATNPFFIDNNNNNNSHQNNSTVQHHHPLLSSTTSPAARRLFDNIIDSPTHRKYTTTPIQEYTKSILSTVQKSTPKISKTPYKVLDAPDLQDDFYLNLVDWGHQNILSVALGSCVYLWNAASSEVTKLCDLGNYDSITSVNWDQKGQLLAIGTNRGIVQLWDVHKSKKVRVFGGHQERVGTIAWLNQTLTSGSRDRTICHRDIRVPGDTTQKYTGHIQEVCGLKWNPTTQLLASGGNDNKLMIWDWRQHRSIFKFDEHIAAVKAIAWNPVQSNILASGGGTADRTIRFWSTSSSSGNLLRTHDTGSQVCNIVWSRTGSELVSTHGYSQNQINVWKYLTMDTMATLTGHTYRVLYLSSSPDGQNIVTGAGDETLRFWNVFTKKQPKGNDSPLKKMSLR